MIKLAIPCSFRTRKALSEKVNNDLHFFLLILSLHLAWGPISLGGTHCDPASSIYALQNLEILFYSSIMSVKEAVSLRATERDNFLSQATEAPKYSEVMVELPCKWSVYGLCNHTRVSMSPLWTFLKMSNSDSALIHPSLTQVPACLPHEAIWVRW